MINSVVPPTLIHKLDEKEVDQNSISFVRFIVILLIVLAAGIGIGFVANKLKSVSSKTASSNQSSSLAKNTAGIADKKTFKDKAEGVLKEGGVDGEGNFHLVRPGGESQNVYLTSTTVDLSTYIGKKVRVWGETFGAQKVGWLMDVGLVETLQ